MPDRTDTAFSASVTTLGKEIFAAVRLYRPTPAERLWYIQAFFALSTKYPGLKQRLFAFAEILPSLSSSRLLKAHLRELVLPGVREFSPALAGLLKAVLCLPVGVPLSLITTLCARLGAGQFIASQDAATAIPAFARVRGKGFAFTADLLGEFASSNHESCHYLERYLDLIRTLSANAQRFSPPLKNLPTIKTHPAWNPSSQISVKLTALHAGWANLDAAASLEILCERLGKIARAALAANVGLTVDAEDVASNDIIYRTFISLFSDPDFRAFPLPGIVVQVYLKDAPKRIETLLDLARTRGQPIAIRLVKGAYAETEALRAAQAGRPSPLVASKAHADAQYEALALKLLQNRQLVYPCFASHNVRSLSAACVLAQRLGLKSQDFELQMLYGMATPIALAFRDRGYLVRLYSPIGDLVSGMGYLVRRLIENTSNESFLRHAFVSKKDEDELLREPDIDGLHMSQAR